LPSFFLCGYTAKEKSVTKANYLLIPRLFSRFLCKKRRKESSQRNAVFFAQAARLPLLKKRSKTIAKSEFEHSAQSSDKSKFELLCRLWGSGRDFFCKAIDFVKKC
jgi:hypothetical protein